MQTRILYDYAISTGSLYRQHCDMAREDASPRVWELHVRVNVLTEYRRAHHEPYEGMSRDELALVAKELANYYSRHIAEMDNG